MEKTTNNSLDHLENASRMISKWPQWKKDLAGVVTTERQRRSSVAPGSNAADHSGRDTERMNWLCQCTAGEWDELQNIRLANKRGFLRDAIDSMMKQ